jgi:cholesterol transport system auxiliary component
MTLPNLPWRTPLLRRAGPTVVFAAAMALSLGLASCISLFPKTAPATLYRFEAQAPAEAGTQASRTVAVLHAAGAFEAAAAGDRILTITGSQAAYIAAARWVSPASVLFNDAVNRTLQNSPSVRVASVGELSRPDYILRVDVLTFETRYANGPQAAPTVVIEARASLSNVQSRASAGSILLAAQTPAADNRVGAIVAAYSAATTQVMGQLENWLGQRARGA